MGIEAVLATCKVSTLPIVLSLWSRHIILKTSLTSVKILEINEKENKVYEHPVLPRKQQD